MGPKGTVEKLMKAIRIKLGSGVGFAGDGDEGDAEVDGGVGVAGGHG